MLTLVCCLHHVYICGFGQVRGPHERHYDALGHPDVKDLRLYRHLLPLPVLRVGRHRSLGVRSGIYF